MKRILLALLFFIVSTILYSQEKIDSALQKVASDISNRSSTKTILCILDFTSSSTEFSEYIQTELTSNVTESGIKVVTRSNMNKIDKELTFQLSGLISDDTALSICERLGANAIVFGQIKELDNKYNLQLKMLDVETASYILFKTYSFSRSSKSEQLMGRAANYYKASIGLFAEVNKNSISKIAPAAGIYFDYSFFRKGSAGLKVIASSDMFEDENKIYSFEVLGTIRLYLVSPSGEPCTGFFIQGDAGGEVISSNEEVLSCFDIGGEIGFRKEFNQFFIEPSVRFGYPYMFGSALSFGVRF